MLSFSNIDETQFEELLFDLLCELDFVNVNWRKGTNLNASPADRGRDIEAQLQRKDIDGETYFDSWFVDCKHYERGVPPEKLQSLLTWAEAERPRVALFVASGFLSNPAKDYLKKYADTRRPPFMIKVWERPQLERILTGKTRLLNKFKLVGPFPFLDLFHPAHLQFIRRSPINSLRYFFSAIDGLSADAREEIMGELYFHIIQPRMRKPRHDQEILRDLMLDEVSYNAFRDKCERIPANILDEHDLVFFLVSRCLESLFRMGDPTGTDSFVAMHRHMILSLDSRVSSGHTDPTRAAEMRKMSEEAIESLPARTKRHYELYTLFCDEVVEKLFNEIMEFPTLVSFDDFEWSEDKNPKGAK